MLQDCLGLTKALQALLYNVYIYIQSVTVLIMMCHHIVWFPPWGTELMDSFEMLFYSVKQLLEGKPPAGWPTSKLFLVDELWGGSKDCLGFVNRASILLVAVFNDEHSAVQWECKEA